jgi:hypothetical protein
VLKSGGRLTPGTAWQCRPTLRRGAASRGIANSATALSATSLGCDYGATSCTARNEAGMVADPLGLRPRLRLLDLGAGAGWPGLYLSLVSGCDVVLTDIPHLGIRLAPAIGVRGETAPMPPGEIYAIHSEAFPTSNLFKRGRPIPTLLRLGLPGWRNYQ